jgi:hypothetical protein
MESVTAGDRKLADRNFAENLRLPFKTTEAVIFKFDTFCINPVISSSIFVTFNDAK